MNLDIHYNLRINNIQVKGNGFFSFEFILTQDGKAKDRGKIDGNYSDSWKPSQFRRVLKNGWAASLVFQKIF